MVELNVIKHLLSDIESLSSYLNGEIVSFNDIERRLFLLNRNENTNLPDQFYKLAQEREFKEIHSLVQLLSIGLENIAEHHLILDDDKIYVKENKENDCQQLITYVPPLILVMAFVESNQPFEFTNCEALNDYFHSYILPNTKYTSIPSSKHDLLTELLFENAGLNDLHVHLNGSTEIDLVWEDFLSFPEKIYKELQLSFGTTLVREQIDQESSLLSPLKFYRLLKIARKLRSTLFDYVFPNTDLNVFPPVEDLLKSIIAYERLGSKLIQRDHPFKHLIRNADDLPNTVSFEGLMYIVVLAKLKSDGMGVIATLFHFYLLIKGLANRLLVQQVHQNGFTQFQKITLNNLREISEKKFHSRFFQQNGNNLGFVKFLEGRFSPKQSQLENTVLIDNIIKGWNTFINGLDTSQKLPELKLVAHFIKRNDSKPNSFIRYKALRLDTWKRAKNLSLLLNKYTKYRELITGVDAASSEFDTPPEAFGPAFRALRRWGSVKHFTYHVGEDFFHLISGIRAVYEAVNFLGLGKNDRVGHATALGISVKIWASVVEESFYIRKGEWLDNLVFLHFYATFLPKKVILELESRIKILVNEVYDVSSFDMDDLITAWQLRKYCPILLLSNSIQEAKYSSVFDVDEWNDIQRQHITPEAKFFLASYNNLDLRLKYDEIISVEPYAVCNEHNLIKLQLKMLKYLSSSNIKIETLPTSNVRIGYYKYYKDYHLHNWLKWKSEGNQLPEIVVGTDDTGIFATNIYNEYANIFCYLVNSKKETPKDVMIVLNELNTNSERFKFI
ncbi:adenosine deaminase [Pedobacter sp. UYEF25]